ncbi:MAG: hypothetical protein WB992_08115 [Bryobacteraceae bacterium]
MNRMWMAVVLFAAFVLSGCDDMDVFDRAKEDFHYSYALQPGGHLDLNNTNGSVDIAGWDRDTIDVSGTKFASTADQLRNVRIKVNVSGKDVSIASEAPNSSGFLHGSYGVRYMIRVPREITLGRVETTNGSVSVDDLHGGGRLGSTNGRISMARDTGDYEVRTTNGSVEFDGCAGAERAETTNGSVRGRLSEGAIEARSTNGSIDLTIDKPRNDEPIRASTVNGGINLTLAAFEGNSVNAETTHGSITLRLPPKADARLTAQSTLSTVTSEISLSSTEEMSKHHLTGRLGNGGPLISATTTTGSIRIARD